MTRDEHIKIEMDRLRAGPALCGQHPGIVREVAESNVNCFVRHGILKLDEPKSAEKRFREVIQGLAPFQRTAAELLSAIDAVGLRLVEK